LRAGKRWPAFFKISEKVSKRFGISRQIDSVIFKSRTMKHSTKQRASLKTLRIEAARLIAAGVGISETGRKIGVNRKSIQRWKKLEGFVRLVEMYKAAEFVDLAWLESLDDDLMQKVLREDLPANERNYYDKIFNEMDLSLSYQIAK
jgi:hypothetical protein